MFFSLEEKNLSAEYLDAGFVIRPVQDASALDWIRAKVIENGQQVLGEKTEHEPNTWLNTAHERISVSNLNDYRIELIRRLNAEQKLRLKYFQLARSCLDAIVGNELAMQMRVNLSIQLPKDNSSLLPIHADVWSGDSPFETVVWVPLVDCFGTKAMFLLPPSETQDLHLRFAEFSGKGNEAIFREYENSIRWIDIQYGEVLIFNQNLPHGNRINQEQETRWSMNCRFKSVFSPYGEKKLGEFFEPITLRAATRIGMRYKLPGAGS